MIEENNVFSRTILDGEFPLFSHNRVDQLPHNAETLSTYLCTYPVSELHHEVRPTSFATLVAKLEVTRLPTAKGRKLLSISAN